MSFSVRDGKLDVVIAAGPRIEIWPSPGVRAISHLCSEAGLTVGQVGGEFVTVRGVIPSQSTGGVVILEDSQKRIHRLTARAVVRVSDPVHFPDPFPGWRSPGLIPLRTAEKLLRESRQGFWSPISVILGTGNRALRLGSQLLESGVYGVYCVESFSQWKAKRFAGWEVERRRFEILGGKLIEAKPLQLLPLGPLLWQLRLQDAQGIRVLEVGRVISAGPYREMQEVREYPPGSALYELDQTAAATYAEDVEGWVDEEERARYLAGRVIRALSTETGPKREELDRTYKRARSRLKRYESHRERPFTPTYQGKWIAPADSKSIRSFSGVPQTQHYKRPLASVECFEEIPCNVCETVCPTDAIQIGKVPRTRFPILNETACTACGICVTACPSSAISLIHENEKTSKSTLSVPWRGSKTWIPGESTVLLNRRGENLGSGRIIEVTTPEGSLAQIVRVELPTHLVWDARGIKKNRTPAITDESYLSSVSESEALIEKVEIHFQGEKRLVRDKTSVSMALFEIGQSRPEDLLMCKDGSCGLCYISVDSVNKLACQTRIHRGMSIRVPTTKTLPTNGGSFLCSCLEITRESILERLSQGNLRSPEAVLAVIHVGEGKCHGQLCLDAFRRTLEEKGISSSQWIDWRFPWVDWILNNS